MCDVLCNETKMTNENDIAPSEFVYNLKSSLLTDSEKSFYYAIKSVKRKITKIKRIAVLKAAMLQLVFMARTIVRKFGHCADSETFAFLNHGMGEPLSVHIIQLALNW